MIVYTTTLSVDQYMGAEMSGHLGSRASVLTRYAGTRAVTGQHCTVATLSPYLVLHVTLKNSADHMCALPLLALLVYQLSNLK